MSTYDDITAADRVEILAAEVEILEDMLDRADRAGDESSYYQLEAELELHRRALARAKAPEPAPDFDFAAASTRLRSMLATEEELPW